MTENAFLDNIPGKRLCEVCKRQMQYKGLGEFYCEFCDRTEYDEYGTVRNYIESHPGATAMEIERETGIKQKVIRQLLREERIEVTKGSASFLKCERCGADIQSGRYCERCKQEMKAQPAEHHSSGKKSGFAMGHEMLDGQKRFTRSK